MILEKINKIIKNPLSIFVRKDLKDLKDKVIEYKCTSINWSIEDFEVQACENEGWYQKENVYDRSKFEMILKLMILEHDANVGISWDTISIYLNEYCKYDE